jgi:hypothetical protein
MTNRTGRFCDHVKVVATPVGWQWKGAKGKHPPLPLYKRRTKKLFFFSYREYPEIKKPTLAAPSTGVSRKPCPSLIWAIREADLMPFVALQAGSRPRPDGYRANGKAPVGRLSAFVRDVGAIPCDCTDWRSTGVQRGEKRVFEGCRRSPGHGCGAALFRVAKSIAALDTIAKTGHSARHASRLLPLGFEGVDDEHDDPFSLKKRRQVKITKITLTRSSSTPLTPTRSKAEA